MQDIDSSHEKTASGTRERSGNDSEARITKISLHLKSLISSIVVGCRRCRKFSAAIDCTPFHSVWRDCSCLSAQSAVLFSVRRYCITADCHLRSTLSGETAAYYLLSFYCALLCLAILYYKQPCRLSVVIHSIWRHYI